MPVLDCLHGSKEILVCIAHNGRPICRTFWFARCSGWDFETLLVSSQWPAVVTMRTVIWTRWPYLIGKWATEEEIGNRYVSKLTWKFIPLVSIRWMSKVGPFISHDWDAQKWLVRNCT